MLSYLGRMRSLLLPTPQEVAASLSDEGGVAAEEAGAAAGPGVKLDDSPEALAEANRMMQEAAAEQKAQAPAGERQASVAEARALRCFLNASSRIPG